MFRKSILTFSCVALFTAAAWFAINADAQRRPTAAPTDALKILQWRSIGPFRGGRSTAVAGVASQPMVFYFGGTGGGVFKTTDGGINWEPVSDGSVFGTGPVGAIGLSDSDPNVV